MEHNIMANVKFYRCFPTTVGEFSSLFNVGEIRDMISHITTAKTKYGYGHNEDDLHTKSHFVNFRDVVLNNSKIYMNNLKYKYEKLEITGMWANKLHMGMSHPPHTHSNNFLSGVYYLNASGDTAPIQFFDPRPQANVLRPRNEPIWENSSMVQFDSVTGKGFIFPSWLMHWVPPTQDERISISWNILVRGNYGEPDTLQNAYI